MSEKNYECEWCHGLIKSGTMGTWMGFHLNGKWLHAECMNEAAAEALAARETTSGDQSLDSLLCVMLGEASVAFMSQPEGAGIVMPSEELSQLSLKYAGAVFAWLRHQSPATREVPTLSAARITELLEEGAKLMRADSREEWRQRAERALTEQEGDRG